MEPIVMLGDCLAFHCCIGGFLAFFALSVEDVVADNFGLSAADFAAEGFAGAVAVFSLSAADTFVADAVVFYFALSAAETFAAGGFAFCFLDFTLSAAILFAADGLSTDERFATWLKGLNLHVAAKWHAALSFFGVHGSESRDELCYVQRWLLLVSFEHMDLFLQNTWRVPSELVVLRSQQRPPWEHKVHPLWISTFRIHGSRRSFPDGSSTYHSPPQTPTSVDRKITRHHCLHAWRRALLSFIGCAIEVPSAWSVAVAFAERCQRRFTWIVSCNVWFSENKAINSRDENNAADKPISSNLC
ncbi:hypothetical protein L1987_53153 [Smallanthus sonchifolius]|uniref:Uncharacterized protein n=1 Tax=Smallanthus sonchifolius TaxID=185202 RepID=A0ACB9EV46_9ASTR|nr:hypothetical protein L1987_53153 [Smallanthus sonchifolius]